jgi:hypothetical protein
VKLLPPDASAICWSASGSGGTCCVCVPPPFFGTVIVPLSVPSATV